MSRSKLYLILSLGCLAGYVWLYLNLPDKLTHQTMEGTTCIIKNVTSIPCPSCGSTRSLVSLLYGDFSQALYWNPLGIILALILIFAPLWILYDRFYKKDTLWLAYMWFEELLKKKRYAIPAIAVILANWAWNIYKAL